MCRPLKSGQTIAHGNGNARWLLGLLESLGLLGLLGVIWVGSEVSVASEITSRHPAVDGSVA